jgi:hypothetical protein
MTLRMKSFQRVAVTAAIATGLCLPNWGCGPPRPSAIAPPPPPPPPGYVQPAAAWVAPQLPAAQTPPSGTISGVVRSFNYGPGGPDGLILDGGVVVHFPPELSSQVTAVAPIGAAVAVQAWSHLGPAGDNLMDAQVITNQRTNGSIRVADIALPAPPPSAGPPPPRGPGPPPVGYLAPPPPVAPAPVANAASVTTQRTAGWPTPGPQGTETTLTGTVRSFNYGPDGQVNGLILDQGAVVFFPPDQSRQVTQIIPVSGRVRVRGWLRTDVAGGRRIMDAETITNRSSGGVVAMPVLAAP